MRIYYFGKLIQDTNTEKSKGKEQPDERIHFVPRAMRKTVGLSHERSVDTSEAKKDEVVEAQISLDFTAAETADNQDKKTGMDTLGDILKELDLNIDSFNPSWLRPQHV